MPTEPLWGLMYLSVLIQITINHLIFLRFAPTEQGLEELLAFARVLLPILVVVPLGMQAHRRRFLSCRRTLHKRKYISVWCCKERMMNCSNLDQHTKTSWCYHHTVTICWTLNLSTCSGKPNNFHSEGNRGTWPLMIWSHSHDLFILLQ